MPWVYAWESEAFLYYLNFELDKGRKKFNLNYLLSMYNDCKMQIIQLHYSTSLKQEITQRQLALAGGFQYWYSGALFVGPENVSKQTNVYLCPDRMGYTLLVFQAKVIRDARIER